MNVIFGTLACDGIWHSTGGCKWVRFSTFISCETQTSRATAKNMQTSQVVRHREQNYRPRFVTENKFYNVQLSGETGAALDRLIRNDPVDHWPICRHRRLSSHSERYL